MRRWERKHDREVRRTMARARAALRRLLGQRRPQKMANRTTYSAHWAWCFMAEIDQEIAAYDAMREQLEADKIGKWVVVRDSKLHGIYETFEEAADVAVKAFGEGPYLIRQVGAPPITLPASVMYNFVG